MFLFIFQTSKLFLNILSLIWCKKGWKIIHKIHQTPELSVLTSQVGASLVVDHAGGQGAVVRWGGAEQDVVGYGLVQHGAVGAGV